MFIVLFSDNYIVFFGFAESIYLLKRINKRMDLNEKTPKINDDDDDDDDDDDID